MRQTRERIVLVHELRELGRAEELLDRSDDRPDVDQRGRRDGLGLLGRHALAHHSVQTGQARADLVLDELADGADAAVAEVVDVVRLDGHGRGPFGAHHLGLPGVKSQKIAQDGRDVRDAELAGVAGGIQAQLLVDLEAPDLGRVVAFGVEVEVVEERAARLGRRRLAGTQLAVEVGQSLFLGVHRVLLEGLDEGWEVGEDLADLRFGHAQSLEEHRHGLLALAIHPHAHGVALVDLEFEPGSARGDDFRREDVLVGGLVGHALEVDAGRAHQLGDDDALGPVDDESAALGHEREVADEGRLALDLAGLVVLELGRHV